MERATPRRRLRVEEALSDWRTADRTLADARTRREAIDQAGTGSLDDAAMKELREAILDEQSAVIAAEDARARFQEAREDALKPVERSGAVMDAELSEPCA
jgi:hypothetical protein